MTDSRLEDAELRLRVAQIEIREAQALLSMVDGDRPPVEPPPVRPPVEPPPAEPPPVEPPPVEPPPVRPPVDDGHWTREQIEALRGVDRSAHQVIGGDPNTGDGLRGWSDQPPDQVMEKFIGVVGYRGFAVIGGNHPDETPAIGHVWQDFEGRPIAPRPGEVFRTSGVPAPVDQYGKGNWFLREYNSKRRRILRGWIHDVPKEHAIYSSFSGQSEIGYMMIENCGGQAIQSVSRPFREDGTPWENNPFEGGALGWIHDVVALNCGHERYGASGGGGSFPISVAHHWQGPGEANGEHLADYFIDNIFVETNHPTRDENGIDLPGNPSAKGAVLFDGGGADWRYGDVKIRVASVKLDRNSREVFKLGNMRSLEIWFPSEYEIAGPNHVELDKGDGKPIGEVVWHGDAAGGGVQIRQHGTQIAWADEDFVLVNGVKQ